VQVALEMRGLTETQVHQEILVQAVVLAMRVLLATQVEVAAQA
jgi:hypothetical protein